MHRVDASLVARKVKATAEELWALVAWAANTSRGRCGVSPVQSALGMVPRDPLKAHVWDRITSSQMNHEEQFLGKVKPRAIGLGVWQERW